MANIYFHFPFCKQACHYCNFHFSTATKYQNDVLSAFKVELDLRKSELNTSLESIYFGGGSPSLIPPKQVEELITHVYKQLNVDQIPEITLEMNPDDVSKSYLMDLKTAGINRVSLGVQSFFESELKMMNRAHSAEQAMRSLEMITSSFDNFSVDLIYGMPYSSFKSWEQNIAALLAFQPPHISSYALTVEPKTALAYQVEKNKIILLEEERVKDQYDHLVTRLEIEGYENYEFSNFGKPGFHSINNSNYWNGKAYLGIGPSAHSYDGDALRSWNVANNKKYLKAIAQQMLPIERESLKKNDRYNEYIMTGLRTQWGVSLTKIEVDFGVQYVDYLEQQVEKHLKDNNMFWDGDYLKISKTAKFLSDGLAADLFLIQR